MSRPRPPTDARLVIGQDATRVVVTRLACVVGAGAFAFAVVAGFVTHDYAVVLAALVMAYLVPGFAFACTYGEVTWVAATTERYVWSAGGRVDEVPLREITRLSGSILSGHLDVELADGRQVRTRWVPVARELARLVTLANPQVQDLT